METKGHSPWYDCPKCGIAIDGIKKTDGTFLKKIPARRTLLEIVTGSETYVYHGACGMEFMVCKEPKPKP